MFSKARARNCPTRSSGSGHAFGVSRSSAPPSMRARATSGNSRSKQIISPTRTLPRGGVEVGGRQPVARREVGLLAEVARVHLGVGQGGAAVAVDEGRGVARRSGPALQVRDDDRQLELAGEVAEPLQERVVRVDGERRGAGRPVGRPGVAGLPALRKQREVGAQRGGLAAGALADLQGPLRVGAGRAELEQGDCRAAVLRRDGCGSLALRATRSLRSLKGGPSSSMTAPQHVTAVLLRSRRPQRSLRSGGKRSLVPRSAQGGSHNLAAPPSMQAAFTTPPPADPPAGHAPCAADRGAGPQSGTWSGGRSTGRSRTIVARRRKSRSWSAASRTAVRRAGLKPSAAAITPSRSPCSRSRSAAVFCPMPRAPGMLSDGSPRSAIRSGTWSGSHAVALAHALDVDALQLLPAAARPQHRHLLADELVGVAVRGQHQRRAAGLLLQRRQRRQHVVGLVRRHLGRRDAERAEQLGRLVQLAHEQRLERVALALVRRPQLVARPRHAAVERDGDRAGLLGVVGLEQHVHQAEHRRHRPPVGPRQRRQGVVGPVQQRIAVDHEQGAQRASFGTIRPGRWPIIAGIPSC